MSIRGTVADSCRSSLANPSASANRIPESLISAISNRLSSSISMQVRCMEMDDISRNRRPNGIGADFRDESARERVPALQAVLRDGQIDRRPHCREDPLDRACRELLGDEEIAESSSVRPLQIADGSVAQTFHHIAEVTIGIGLEALTLPATLEPTIEITGLGQCH